MNKFCNIFIIFMIFVSTGCDRMVKPRTKPVKIIVQRENQDAKIIYDLLLTGEEYNKLNKNKKIKKCNQLKQAYQVQAYWQTAWLLVNAINDDFSCLNSVQTLNLLNTIKNTQTESTELLWLNNNQINLVSKLVESKQEIIESNLEINYLRRELEQSEQLLRQYFSKIQELKTIETNINKKLEDE